MVSVPSWPSTTSLPSPGAQRNVSLPAPRKATSSPWSPIAESLPSPPSSDVGAGAAGDRVVAGPAVEDELDGAGRQAGGVDAVVAAEAPFTVSESVASAWSIVTWAERPVTEMAAADQRDIDRVFAAAAVDGDAVELAVARWRRRSPPGRSPPA